MTTHSQSIALQSGGSSPAIHHKGGIAALLLLSVTGLLLSARRLWRLRRFHRLLRRHDKRGMPLGLFLFLFILGVPLVVGGILIICGVPVLTSVFIGIGALVLLVLALLAGLYFFGGEKVK